MPSKDWGNKTIGLKGLAMIHIHNFHEPPFFVRSLAKPLVRGDIVRLHLQNSGNGMYAFGDMLLFCSSVGLRLLDRRELIAPSAPNVVLELSRYIRPFCATIRKLSSPELGLLLISAGWTSYRGAIPPYRYVEKFFHRVPSVIYARIVKEPERK